MGNIIKTAQANKKKKKASKGDTWVLDVFCGFDIWEVSNPQKTSRTSQKYFRQGNPRLKELIIYGLETYPARVDLLDDLLFFHEFSEVYPLVVKYYMRACLLQEDMETISNLVLDFFDATRSQDHREY